MKHISKHILIAITAFIFSCSKNDNTVQDPQADCTREVRTNFSLVKQNNLGGINGDFGQGIVETFNNGYLICGILEDEKAHIVGVDNNLNMLWELTPNNPGISSLENIIKCKDGNYIAVGFKQTVLDDIDFDLYAIKIDGSGNIIWENTYGVNSITDTTIDLIETSNGDVVLVGSIIIPPVTPENFNTDITVTRIDKDGNLLWNKVLGGTKSESGASVLEETNGNILVAGSTNSNDGDVSVNKGESDVWIIKLNALGDLLEEKTFGSSESDAVSFIGKLKNGNIVVVANSSGSDKDVVKNNEGENIWLFTLTPSLNIINQNSIGDFEFDRAFKIIERDNNELFLVGSTNDDASTDVFGGRDFWLLKLSESLQVISEDKFGGSEDEYASNMILNNNNNEAVIIGSTNSNDCDVTSNNGDFDIWVTVVRAIE